mmetsp:Transcript_376/g.1274  ORF Transcript_376/g.1274 Transcript_376/m.1274 type:complete len:277 (-) Transcript_376:340-1170(-)
MAMCQCENLVWISRPTGLGPPVTDFVELLSVARDKSSFVDNHKWFRMAVSHGCPIGPHYLCLWPDERHFLSVFELGKWIGAFHTADVCQSIDLFHNDDILHIKLHGSTHHQPQAAVGFVRGHDIHSSGSRQVCDGLSFRSDGIGQHFHGNVPLFPSCMSHVWSTHHSLGILSKDVPDPIRAHQPSVCVRVLRHDSLDGFLAGCAACHAFQCVFHEALSTCTLCLRHSMSCGHAAALVRRHELRQRRGTIGSRGNQGRHLCSQDVLHVFRACRTQQR